MEARARTHACANGEARARVCEAELGVRKIEPKIMRREPIPDVEWWDMPFLKEDRPLRRQPRNTEAAPSHVPHAVCHRATLRWATGVPGLRNFSGCTLNEAKFGPTPLDNAQT